MGRSQRAGKTMQKKSICYIHKQLRQRTNNNTTRIRNTIFHAINFARRTIWKVCIFQHVVCFFPLSHFLSVRLGFFFVSKLFGSFIHSFGFMIRRKLELSNHYRLSMIVSNDDKFTECTVDATWLTHTHTKKQPLSAKVIIKLVLLSVIFSIYTYSAWWQWRYSRKKGVHRRTRHPW